MWSSGQAVKMTVKISRFVDPSLSCDLVSRARCSRRAEGRAAHRKGEKERLVTIDRFPWHGGIQNRDVISNVTRKEVSALPFFEASTLVIWLRVVRAVRLQL